MRIWMRPTNTATTVALTVETTVAITVAIITKITASIVPGDSTQSALIRITEDMRKAIEEEKITVLVLFDFKCAFDTIDHATLLARLRDLSFGAGALRLLHSYLSGRSQAVVDTDGVAAEFVECTSGVPQGSSPAPVLFAAYIDTVVAALRHCADTCMLFADDLQIYLSCEPADLNDTIGRLCEDAQAVLDWSRRCGLRLNAQKTQAIVVASDQRHMRMDMGACQSLVVDGVVVPFSPRVRDLGLVISNNLAWTAQVNQISSRVHGVLHRLRARARILPTSVRSMLVSSLVLPHFDYVCAVLRSLPAQLDIRLRRLFNTAVRFIYGLPRDAAMLPYIERLGWLTPALRRDYFLGMQVQRSIISGRPPYLIDLLPVRRVSTRALWPTTVEVFQQDRISTETYGNGFKMSVVRMWNGLPRDIIELPSLPVFKTQLRSHLMQRIGER
ncbi:uncharacterized protein LOC106658042 [Trichogramma pretiosum]|uniref:uncharacterized protein LOC106658042 n=1 Tax=Trichogramma pretiosum TaxID=7493 RepID=UPI0006C965F7|nr:uncharacterized protein LOC106658042 [Trichogramma pretiosum]